MRPELRSVVAAYAARFAAESIEAAVDDWIHHRLSGEPELLTRSRHAYVHHHLARALAALALLPASRDGQRLLELGSGLYLMSFLAERLLGYRLELVQYWGRPSGRYRSRLVDDRDGSERSLEFCEFNAEEEAFPYADGSFDAILNCDTVEHMLRDPVRMLAGCHRVLKPGGAMVVTTPNVLRLDNVARLIEGTNIHDKYVRESASARHPREYAPGELQRLLEWTGFEVEHIETCDVTPASAGRMPRALARGALAVARAATRLSGRDGGVPLRWRGEQIVARARRAGAPRLDAPEFLYEAPADADRLIAALYGGGPVA
jgi:SAM-dependent methyltransferase